MPAEVYNCNIEKRHRIVAVLNSLIQTQKATLQKAMLATTCIVENIVASDLSLGSNRSCRFFSFNFYFIRIDFLCCCPIQLLCIHVQ